MSLTANLLRLESSIQKHAGPGAQPRWGVQGDKAPRKKKIKIS